ncbi:hypothetical protein HPB49_024994 [Dermacentor silvarum]|uniref:Uncharacterized protein n=1 Tax=Dermacentor silvarum TaxID=543639 RepID=A0ACB8DHG3_DERSI|nr:hypothetical protein HPB49_024994 [Dermacentor silvarum]
MSEHPRAVLWDRRLLSELSWDATDDLLMGRRERKLIIVILRESKMYKLEQLVKDKNFVVYGDPAYLLRPLLMKPYGGASLTPSQRAFKNDMNRVRQAVE